uniref:Uncharacterized protein n=1 Tax=Romanomermis culicivorax TaxID=13658 RepID=A0A915KCS5_ROMCU
MHLSSEFDQTQTASDHAFLQDDDEDDRNFTPDDFRSSSSMLNYSLNFPTYQYSDQEANNKPIVAFLTWEYGRNMEILEKRASIWRKLGCATLKFMCPTNALFWNFRSRQKLIGQLTDEISSLFDGCSLENEDPRRSINSIGPPNFYSNRKDDQQKIIIYCNDWSSCVLAEDFNAKIVGDNFSKGFVYENCWPNLGRRFWPRAKSYVEWLKIDRGIKNIKNASFHPKCSSFGNLLLTSFYWLIFRLNDLWFTICRSITGSSELEKKLSTVQQPTVELYCSWKMECAENKLIKNHIDDQIRKYGSSGIYVDNSLDPNSSTFDDDYEILVRSTEFGNLKLRVAFKDPSTTNLKLTQKILALINLLSGVSQEPDCCYYCEVYPKLNLPIEVSHAFLLQLRYACTNGPFQNHKKYLSEKHFCETDGCKKIDEFCSWSESDNLGCCHRLMCRCNFFGSNCRCEPRLG